MKKITIQRGRYQITYAQENGWICWQATDRGKPVASGYMTPEEGTTHQADRLAAGFVEVQS